MLWLVWLMFSENLTQNLKESPTFFFDVSTPKEPSERALLFLEQDKCFFLSNLQPFQKIDMIWGEKSWFIVVIIIIFFLIKKNVS